MPTGAIIRSANVLRRSETLRHIGILFSGKAAMQLVALLSQPVLARLYSPAQFGEFAFLNSLLAILMVAASGRYESGIILTSRKQHAQHLFQLSQLFLLAYLVLISLLLLFVPGSILSNLGHQPLSPLYLWLIPLLVICAGYWEIVYNWLVRFQKYSSISTALLIQRLLMIGGAVAAVILPVPGNGLIFGLILSSIGIFVVALLLKQEPLQFPLRGIKAYSYSFREFPFFSVPSLYLLLIIQHLPVLWFSHFFSTEITGAFSMAYLLVMLGCSSLMMSAGQVYHQQFAQSKAPEQLILLRKYLLAFLFLLAPFTVLLYIWGTPVLTWLLGSEWQQAGKIASMLAPLGLFQGISSILTIPLSVYRKQSVLLFLQVLKFVILLMALGAGYYWQDVFLAFDLMSLGFLLHLLIVVAVVYPILNSRLKQQA
ncbi:lipopolysaccharide biosynthesis protein [Nafulsella turpanensis]|uniref:lipopolysaccharide biosynthesis protein n=1 Tax=Nafulsella turpanensis TaxID=1265690 RepID=UPI00036EA185|nr:hypothetical protein [Nafulsella turpanensis]